MATKIANKASLADDIVRAINDIIAYFTLFSFFALSRPTYIDDSVPTAHTDGKEVVLGRKFAAGLSHRQRVFVVLHELGHILFGHHLRRNGRDHKVWNMACDYFLNPLIMRVAGNKVEFIEGGLMDSRFDGMSEDDIYKELTKQGKGKGKDPEGNPGNNKCKGEGNGNGPKGGQKQDGKGKGKGDPTDEKGDGSGDSQGQGEGDEQGQQGDGGGEGAGPEMPGDFGNPLGSFSDAKGPGGREMSDAEREQALADLRDEVQRSVLAAKGRGNLPGEIAKMLGEALASKVDYRTVLREFVQSAMNGGYDWMRCASGWVSHETHMPSLRSKRLEEFAVIIDTSGSIYSRPNALEQFSGDIREILDNFPGSKARIYYVDTKVQKVDEAGDEFEKLEALGGGGTSFSPAFEEMEAEGYMPKFAVYYTDMEGDFPKSEPQFPVLWINYGDAEYEAPFGTVVKAELDD